MTTPPPRDNPYEAGTSGALPTRCFIPCASSMVLPRRCVVCDSPHAELHSYVQEHIPLVVPPLAVHRRTPVVLPYCAAHAREFHRRFRILRNVQRVMVGIFFGGVIAAIVVEKQPAMSAILPILIWASLISLFLLPITVVVRRFLYDAFFRHRGGGVKVSSSYAVFIERLREANGLAPTVAGNLPADLAPAVSEGRARYGPFYRSHSAGNQLSSRGGLLPGVVLFIQAVVAICTGLTIVGRGPPDALAIAVCLVLNGFAVLVAWLLLRAARRGTVAGWGLGHWMMYLVGGYALGRDRSSDGIRTSSRQVSTWPQPKSAAKPGKPSCFFHAAFCRDLQPRRGHIP